MGAIVLVAVFYEGLLDCFEVFSSRVKARKRYREILKEYDLTEKSMEKSDYRILLEPEIPVQ